MRAGVRSRAGTLGRLGTSVAIVSLILAIPLRAVPSPAPPQIDEALLFGPLGEAGYRRYAPTAPNDPEYAVARIRARFSQAEGGEASDREDRGRMWGNYRALEEALRGNPDQPFVEAVYAALRELNPLAREQLVAVGAKGLGGHLQEISRFVQAFYLREDRRSRFPEVLSDRQAQLLAYLVAPLHDSMKFLGSYHAQVMPDHEVLGAELVRSHLPGRLAHLGTSLEPMTAEDAAFVAGVLGDHENIEKERGREGRIRSLQALDRAKALFFLADTLTGVVVPQGSQGTGWRLDQALLEARFTDLYFRHIDLVKGKIFRPEWGLFTLANLTETLGVLIQDHGLRCAGITAEKTVTQSLRDAALEAIERALEADRVRGLEVASGSAPGVPLFDPEQRGRIEAVRRQLEVRE